MIRETDAKTLTLEGKALTDYLNTQSDNFANDTLSAYRNLAMQLVTKMTDYCELNFKTDENL